MRTDKSWLDRVKGCNCHEIPLTFGLWFNSAGPILSRRRTVENCIESSSKQNCWKSGTILLLRPRCSPMLNEKCGPICITQDTMFVFQLTRPVLTSALNRHVR